MPIRSLWSYTLAIPLVGIAVSAAPAHRRDTPTPSATPLTISQMTTGAIASFLSSRGANNLPFNVNGPTWPTINFAGNAASNLTEFMINNDIYLAFDTQVDRLANSTSSFSENYKDFVQQITKTTTAPSDQESAQVNATKLAMVKACFQEEPKMLNGALQEYNSIALQPATNKSDSGFLAWTSMQDPDFMQAKNDCQETTIAYYNAVDTANGDDADVYIAARENIQPLLQEDASFPGINMQVQQSLTTNLPDGLNLEMVYPPSHSPPRITVHHPVRVRSLAVLNSALFMRVSESAVTYITRQNRERSLEVQTQNFKVNFGALALLDVDQGLWFDGYRLAKAAQNPDSKHAGAQAIFNDPSFFGSANQPGPLSVYNAQVLVGYQPTYMIQFSDLHTNSSNSSTEAGFDISALGLFDIGGYGGSTESNTHFNNGTQTLAISDNTTNAYLIGFVQNMPLDVLYELPRLHPKSGSVLVKLKAMPRERAGWDPSARCFPGLVVSVDDTWGEGLFGVRSTHIELAGKVEQGWVVPRFVGKATDDLCDHGTGVAAFMAGNTLGVARKATIVPARITNETCKSTPDDIVAAVNWAVSDYQSRCNAKAGIINISAEVVQTAATEAAFAAVSHRREMHVVVSAGNNDQNQCFGGPSAPATQRVKDVGQLVVGATDWGGSRWSFLAGHMGSNYGDVIFAPGTSMSVASNQSDTTINYDGVESSGTSYATPLVSGTIAALVTSGGNLDPSAMKALVVQNSVHSGGLKDLNGSPDIFLQSPIL
ncbi:peptidase S8/S53 domain-containing protein [Mycena leptocephala]|nr:peptidase S8/S53 domain-containing protein [Mycena leptocephala]